MLNSVNLNKEDKTEGFDDFIEELHNLQVKYNFWIKPVIDFDGPKVIFNRLSEVDLGKLKINSEKKLTV